jgi:hypothetical protein
MGFEPTTASLEGWNSTTELRPPISPSLHSTVSIANAHTRLIHQPTQAHEKPDHLRPTSGSPTRRHMRRLSWWAGKDSNLGRHKPADLQSAPFGHLGTCPH